MIKMSSGGREQRDPGRGNNTCRGLELGGGQRTTDWLEHRMWQGEAMDEVGAGNEGQVPGSQ